MIIHADLHIHSVLSPCGDLEMSPAAIVRQARILGLDVIAVADHNSMDNSFYTAEAAKDSGLHVIYGMEAQTEEDIHILCLFDERRNAEKFQEQVYPALPDLENDADIFGEQVVVDPADNIIRFEKKLLLNALAIDLRSLTDMVRGLEGVVIPCHVESEKNGLLMTMGFIPDEIRDCILEVSYNARTEDITGRYPELAAFPLIANSDAHYLRDIGRGFTCFDVSAPTIVEIVRSAREGRFRAMRPQGVRQP